MLLEAFLEMFSLRIWEHNGKLFFYMYNSMYYRTAHEENNVEVNNNWDIIPGVFSVECLHVANGVLCLQKYLKRRQLVTEYLNDLCINNAVAWLTSGEGGRRHQRYESMTDTKWGRGEGSPLLGGGGLGAGNAPTVIQNMHRWASLTRNLTS